LLPPAVLVLLLAARRRREVIRMALPAAVRDEAHSWRARLLGLPALLAGLAAAGALLSATGPYAAARRVPERRRARSICLALDASESMRAVDMALDATPASRMEAALRFAGEFVQRREGDRIAVVAFGGRAVTQCPLTFDRGVARTLLGYVRPEMLGKRTALGEGIALGVARLDGAGALVLLSDGENTAGEVTPAEAARAAAARDVRVYAVGVGSDGPAPVPARLPSGRVRMQMKHYALDEAALRGLTERTGGRYFRAADAAALGRVFAEIDRLERHETPTARTVPAGRLTGWIGGVAAGCLALALLASATFLRAAPGLR
jgi:Ca-activated chloride channel family protein